MISIIPTPKHLEEREGAFNLHGAAVFVKSGTDSRVRKAASTLCTEISEKTGDVTPLTVADPCGRAIIINYTNGDGEGYRLTVSKESVTAEGDSPAGAFYAIQTLRQLIRENGEMLPCCFIDDAPDFLVRGFYQDITRGRVNSPKKLREIADLLAYYKINSLQLYVEDAFLFREFEGIITSDEAMTADEMIDFDDYCYNNFIELVPSLSTFGHLFTLLQSDRYNYMSELPGHKMTTDYWMEKQWHHTVDVYNPDSIKVIGSMIEQYISLFRSDKFNICCDETMDLCSGKNRGKDKGEAYFYYLNMLIEIVKKHGKTVMMWGDECMAHPEMMKEKVPSDTVMLDWCYHKTVNEWIPKFFSDQGFLQIVCPGTSSWSRFIEDIDTSVGNITDFANHGKKFGALGLLNTNWGDFGHICSFNCNLYGMLFGAQKSWNVDAPTDEEFTKTASLLLYDVTEFNMVDTIYNLGTAEKSSDWFRFVMWHSANCLEGRYTELKYNEDGTLTEKDAVRSIELCRNEIERLRSLGRESDPRIEDMILAAEGILLMNREYLYVNEVEGYGDGETLQKDFNDWLKRYKAAWLRDDKPSQLWRLSEFIENITKVPTGRKEVK
ncbi:MAG: beta-N-acetylhexosaminidase [Clostridia bacterium]|nr:beta-N-acetylhexosaminidase [Clostridia bacterium]